MIVNNRRWGEKYGKCNDVVRRTVGKNVGEARQWECVFVWHYNFPNQLAQSADSISCTVNVRSMTVSRLGELDTTTDLI